jgi:signal transduction histidine kinase
MKSTAPFPFEKLLFFYKQLYLEEDERRVIDCYQELFVARKADFAQYCYEYFFDIPETKVILEHATSSDKMKAIWAQWFESLFKGKCDQSLLPYLWRSGLRHVELNLDKRFVNLGYFVARQFCYRLARREVPLDDIAMVLAGTDKMVDLCLLIETHAYISGTSQCDMEVIKGIAHQVRNPITIIGANTIRLQKLLGHNNPYGKTFERILAENNRLERMVNDIVIYSEIFQKEPKLSDVTLEHPIMKALEKLKESERMQDVAMEIGLDPELGQIQGDADDLEALFFYVFQNCLEAMAQSEKPYVRISSRLIPADPRFIEVEIFNTGTSPMQEEVENLFVPFYSSKPHGTGFGLPIAQLAARKSLGDVCLEPVPGQGTRCIVKLPVPISNHSSASTFSLATEK